MTMKNVLLTIIVVALLVLLWRIVEQAVYQRSQGSEYDYFYEKPLSGWSRSVGGDERLGRGRQEGRSEEA